MRISDCRSDVCSSDLVETVYFGGGTPSLLSAMELNRLLDTLGAVHPVASNCEITLEANPDDLDPVNIAGLRKTAVNRLSIGVQSFFDDDLQWLNCVNTGERKSVVLGQSVSVRVDLGGCGIIKKKKWIMIKKENKQEVQQ